MSVSGKKAVIFLLLGFIALPFVMIPALFMMPTDSARLLRALGAPPGAAVIQPAEDHWRDGTSPEIAWITYAIPADETTIRAYYTAACARRHMKPADAQDKAMHGKGLFYVHEKPDRHIYVNLHLKCGGNACETFVEVLN